MPDLANMLSDPTDLARIAVGLLGVLLLIGGARIYRLAIISPGLVGGAFLGLGLGLEPTAGLIAAGAFALIGAVLSLLLERLAVALAGALIAGGLADALAPLALHTPTPWYVPVAAALLGLLLFPRLFKALLPLVTSLLGALALAWALQRPDDLLIIGGAAAAGLILQLLTRRRRGED